MRVMYSLLVFPFILFTVSVLGIIINWTNIILLLTIIEIMLLSVSLTFLIVASSVNNFTGLVIAVLIITVASLESVIGLSIMISSYKI